MCKMSRSRDHADVGAFALDDHVGCDRRPVQDHVDIAGGNASDLADFDDALHDADRLVRRRRRHLVHKYFLARSDTGLFQHDVGERSSDVNSDAYHSFTLHFSLPPARGRRSKTKTSCVLPSPASCRVAKCSQRRRRGPSDAAN
jgi:hypothetical protein